MPNEVNHNLKNLPLGIDIELNIDLWGYFKFTCLTYSCYLNIKSTLKQFYET